MGSAGKYKKCENKPIKGRKITGFSIPRSVRLPRCSGEMRRRDIRHGCAANIVTTQRGSSAPDSVPRPRRRGPKKQEQTHFSATPRSDPEAAEGPRMALTLGGKNAQTNPLYPRNCCTFCGGRWRRSTTGRAARPALISPSRFSLRSHRENRAGQLLSQTRAREATERERKNKPTSATPRDRRKERITIDAMSAAGFFEVSPSCADAASRATASSRRPRQGCGLA